MVRDEEHGVERVVERGRRRRSVARQAAHHIDIGIDLVEHEVAQHLDAVVLLDDELGRAGPTRAGHRGVHVGRHPRPGPLVVLTGGDDVLPAGDTAGALHVDADVDPHAAILPPALPSPHPRPLRHDRRRLHAAPPPRPAHRGPDPRRARRCRTDRQRRRRCRELRARRPVRRRDRSESGDARTASGDRRRLRGVAEHLPFRDRSFDAAIGDLHRAPLDRPDAGLAELQRVSRRQVILTFDHELERSYLAERLLAASPSRTTASGSRRSRPSPVRSERTTSRSVPVPHDCMDGFMAAYWRRPERYLDPEVRANISGLALLHRRRSEPGMRRLAADLESGAWHERLRPPARPRRARRRLPPRVAGRDGTLAAPTSVARPHRVGRDHVGRLRSWPYRPAPARSPEMPVLGITPLPDDERAPTGDGWCFRRTPRPGQGRLTGRPTIGLLRRAHQSEARHAGRGASPARLGRLRAHLAHRGRGGARLHDDHAVRARTALTARATSTSTRWTTTIPKRRSKR